MTNPIQVTQEDHEAAQGYLCRWGRPSSASLAKAFARYRLAAEHRGYMRAIEDAARVAECRHEEWRMPHPDDALPGEVCDDVSACRDIAAAIRNLKP